MNKLLTCEKSNPKEFGDLIQTIRNETKASKASSISPDAWFAYFKKLNTDTNEENLEKIKHLIQCFANKNVSALDKDISFMELEKAVKYLKKTKKAQGADSISNEMIKASFPFLKNAFLKLFNVVLKSNFYPSVWGLGHIVPIFKSGTVSDPSNYRGISISSCLGKP